MPDLSKLGTDFLSDEFSGCWSDSWNGSTSVRNYVRTVVRHRAVAMTFDVDAVRVSKGEVGRRERATQR